MSVRAGTRLDGRYRLTGRLAVGGMGEVWSGVDEVLGRNVAVKVLRAELAEDTAFRKRFRAEARTAGGLPHNGIASVFDYGETTVGPDGISPSPHAVQGDGIAYLVMELVPGEPLSAIITREGALAPERAASLLGQAARALHAAHLRGVVHRDVKPANLMVTPEGRVKVTDFGIARPTDHEPLTMTGQVMGTAHYLAPELARGEDASPLSDVYALGVVFYECLAGRRPFDGDNQVLVATAHLSQEPPPLPNSVPSQAKAAVAAAMEKDPARRVPSAEALAVALEKFAVHDATALDGIRPASSGSPFGMAPMISADGSTVSAPQGGPPTGAESRDWNVADDWSRDHSRGAAASSGAVGRFDRGEVDRDAATTIQPQPDISRYDRYEPGAGFRPDSANTHGGGAYGPDSYADPYYGSGKHANPQLNTGQTGISQRGSEQYPPRYSDELPLPPRGHNNRRTPRRGLGVWGWLLGALAIGLVLLSLLLILRGRAVDGSTTDVSPSVTTSSKPSVAASTASTSGSKSTPTTASASKSTRPSVSASTRPTASRTSSSPTAARPSTTTSAVVNPTPAPSRTTPTPTPSATPSTTVNPPSSSPTAAASVSVSAQSSASPAG